MGDRSQADILARARDNKERFFRLIDSAAAAQQPVKTIAGALGLNEGEMGVMRNKNLADTIKAWRKLFTTYQWLSRDKVKVVDHLLEREVICKYCYQTNSKSGVLDAISSTLSDHEKTQTHLNLAGKAPGAAPGPQPSAAEPLTGKKRLRQIDMKEAHGVVERGSQDRRKRALLLAVGALVAGGNGATSVPYSSIGPTMSNDFLVVMSNMESGFPGATAIRTSVLPNMVEMVKTFQDEAMKGRDISIAVDGGSSQLVNGIKLLPWIALSPELDFDIVIDISLLPVHETAEIQAKQLDELCSRRGIPKNRIVWMVADNASVNKATVDLLRTTYGFRTRLARCIDHSLSLVFTAFTQPFEQEFQMKAMLRHIRTYIKAGGGASRRATLVEHALTMSGMDFADTRWGSFFRAVEYMMGVQTPRELTAAREQLETMSKWGDASAAEALKQPDAARSRWTVIAEALESMGEDAKVAKVREEVEVKEVKLDALLAQVNSWKMFAGFYACSKVFTSVPALFTVLQGDERFEPQLDGLSKDGANSTGDIIAVMHRLLNDLKTLCQKDSNLRDVIVEQTREACESRLDDVITRSRRDDEPLLSGSDSFSEADVATFRENAMANIAAALADVKRVIKSGAKAFKSRA